MSTPEESDQPEASAVFEQVHELLAEIRGASSVLADPRTPPGGAFEAGARAFPLGPQAAVLVTAQMAARRLDQANCARRDAGKSELAFPRGRFEKCLRLRPSTEPRGGRREARRDALDYLAGFVVGYVPDSAPLADLVTRHGYPAFSAMLVLATRRR